MAFKYNPFAGTLDIAGITGPAGAAGTDAGMVALPTITGRTGGAASDLDSLTTAAGGDYDVNDVVMIFVNEAMEGWILKAGTDAEDEVGGIVRPDDYAGTTNEKVWRKQL